MTIEDEKEVRAELARMRLELEEAKKEIARMEMLEWKSSRPLVQSLLQALRTSI